MVLRLAAVLALALAASAAASEKNGPVVVELFTSQGCNSCPPADAYLGELTGRPDLLTLAFHVDYWNYIGWTDRFARPWATARQKAYQKSLHERFVYTPQIVVDGRAQGVGSDRAAIERLIAAAETAPPGAGHPALALHWRDDGALVVDVGGGQSPPGAPADIWLVGFDGRHKTEVLRGENEGRMATDYHPVRTYRRIGAWPGWSLELVVPRAEADAAGDGGIAVLVQAAHVGPLFAAAEIAPH
ncbi:MAG: DUF1223 domain-containing protein [Stellaceae bacterium]